MSVVRIRVPDDLEAEVRKEAERRGDTFSGTIRAILMEYLAKVAK